MIEVALAVWAIGWCVTNAVQDIAHAIRGTENPRYALKREKARAAGKPIGDQPRYGSSDYWADFRSDYLKAKTEKRRKKAAAKAKAASANIDPVPTTPLEGVEVDPTMDTAATYGAPEPAEGRPAAQEGAPTSEPAPAGSEAPAASAPESGPSPEATPAAASEPASATPVPPAEPTAEPTPPAGQEGPDAEVIPLGDRRRKVPTSLDWLRAAREVAPHCHGRRAHAGGPLSNGTEAYLTVWCESPGYRGVEGDPGCRAEWEIRMRWTGTAVEIVSVTQTVRGFGGAPAPTDSDAQQGGDSTPEQPTSQPNENNGGTSMSQPTTNDTPTGEVTGLVSAQEQAQQWSEEAAAQTPQLETFGAYLSGPAEVTDEAVHNGIAQAQEHFQAAAAAMASVHQALLNHDAVREAHMANPGAGSKDFNLSE